MLRGEARASTHQTHQSVGLWQTFAKFSPKFAVWSRRAESRAKVAVSRQRGRPPVLLLVVSRSYLQFRMGDKNAHASFRLLALLKNMFGEEQMPSLADYVQAALMLRYNGREIG